MREIYDLKVLRNKERLELNGILVIIKFNVFYYCLDLEIRFRELGGLFGIFGER